MATFNKFNQFVQDLSHAKHDLRLPGNGGNTLKVALVNTAPTAGLATYSQLSSEAPNANGYTTGGATATITGSSQTSGTYTLIIADTSWTATGGSIGPFRYAVLYNDTQTSPSKPLIGWWDYGSSITLLTGETFTVDFDGSNGVLTLA